VSGKGHPFQIHISLFSDQQTCMQAQQVTHDSFMFWNKHSTVHLSLVTRQSDKEHTYIRSESP